MRKYEPIDLSRVRTRPIAERESKVRVEDFARAPGAGASAAEWIASLPGILAGRWLREVAAAIVEARSRDRVVIFGFGAHVVKCGLGPVVVDLMRRGIVTCVATHGAGSVHDAEIALFGQTSEDVAAGISHGTFGMARETGEFLNQAAARAARDGIGLGRAIGEALVEARAPHTDLSILARAARLGLPATVHTAIGADIHHMHPSADGAALGAASHTDFRLFASVVADLTGGVIINAGSAVALPMAFEKALAAARNLGHEVREFVGVNLDFVQHYRPTLNPVARAQELGGRGYALTGHHEIMIPLLAQAVIERSAE